MSKPKIAVLLTKEMKESCISSEDWERLNSLSEVMHEERDQVTEQLVMELIKDADGVVTGWGTPAFPKASIDNAGRLRIIAHSAGSIKVLLGQVKDTIIQRNIQVTSSVASLGIGVAEFALGMILTTMKRVWWFAGLTKKGKWIEGEQVVKVKEPYKAVIGIIAASSVGRHLIKLLSHFDVTILVYDPHLSKDEASDLGVKKVSLEELMKNADVVSIHAPATAQTRHMINKDNLKLMKDEAILINTARGSVINEKDLIEELETGRITACLDVTEPEPPCAESPFRNLQNVILTPHIAGAISNDRLRNGKYAVDDLESFFKNGYSIHPVDFARWDILA